MESIFQQVDKVIEDSAKKQKENNVIHEAEEEVVEPKDQVKKAEKEKCAQQTGNVWQARGISSICRTCYQGREEEERKVYQEE